MKLKLLSMVCVLSLAALQLQGQVSYLPLEVGNEYRPIGLLLPKTVNEVKATNLTVGCEVLDRDYANYDEYKTYLPTLGMKKISLQAGWAKTEKVKGVYDFAWLDHIIDDALARGMEIWLQTSYGNPIYEGGGNINLGGGMPTSPEAKQAWNRWVEAMATRYLGKVHEWEIWNEPDLSEEIPAEDIVDLNIRTAEIIADSLEHVRKAFVKDSIRQARIVADSLEQVRKAFVKDSVKRAKIIADSLELMRVNTEKEEEKPVELPEISADSLGHETDTLHTDSASEIPLMITKVKPSGVTGEEEEDGSPDETSTEEVITGIIKKEEGDYMIGKKKKAVSGILSAALVLSMTVTMVPFDVSAAGDGTDSDSSLDNLVMNKTVQLEDDGTYTINLEAYAKGQVSTETVKRVIPADIVLVLPGTVNSANDSVTYNNVVYPLIEADDYTALVTITMEYGGQIKSITIPFSGFYEKDNTVKEESVCSLLVDPYSTSAHLNIEQDRGKWIPVGSLDFMLSTATNTNTKNPVIFASSNRDPEAINADEFRLVHESATFNTPLTQTNSIGFDVRIRNLNADGGTASYIFDGTATLSVADKLGNLTYGTDSGNNQYPSSGDWGGIVPAKIYSKLQHDNAEKSYYLYNGEIEVMMDPGTNVMLEGRYTGTVYIHVIADETRV